MWPVSEPAKETLNGSTPGATGPGAKDDRPLALLGSLSSAQRNWGCQERGGRRKMSYPIRIVSGMEIWKPPTDKPQLLDWWLPLLAFARRVRADQVPWLVIIEDFELIGRFDRPPRPSVSIYRHRQTGGQVGVDRSGQSYRFIEYHSGSSPGRLAETSIRSAVWAAGLPDVAPPVTYLQHEPVHRLSDDLSPWSEGADEFDDELSEPGAGGEGADRAGRPARSQVGRDDASRRRIRRSPPRSRQVTRHLSLVQSPSAS